MSVKEILVNSWSTIKDYADNHLLSLDYMEDADVYYIFCSNQHSGVSLYYKMLKSSSDNEVAEFEGGYKGTIEELFLSSTVPGVTERARTITPASGEKIIITAFGAEGAYDNNVACQLLWDYGGQNETVIWSVRGSGKMPFNHTVPSSDTDGSKKLAIAISNATLSAIHASVYMSMTRIV